MMSSNADESCEHPLLVDYRQLIFDLPGVLIDIDRWLLDGLRPLFQQAGWAVDSCEMLRRFDVVMARICATQEEVMPETLMGLAYAELSHQLGVEDPAFDALAFARQTRTWPVYADVPSALLYLRKFFSLAVICPERYRPMAYQMQGITFLEGELCNDVRISSHVPSLYVGRLDHCPKGADWCQLERAGDVQKGVKPTFYIQDLLDLVKQHHQHLTKRGKAC